STAAPLLILAKKRLISDSRSAKLSASDGFASALKCLDENWPVFAQLHPPVLRRIAKRALELHRKVLEQRLTPDHSSRGIETLTRLAELIGRSDLVKLICAAPSDATAAHQSAQGLDNSCTTITIEELEAQSIEHMRHQRYREAMGCYTSVLRLL